MMGSLQQPRHLCCQSCKQSTPSLPALGAGLVQQVVVESAVGLADEMEGNTQSSKGEHGLTDKNPS